MEGITHKNSLKENGTTKVTKHLAPQPIAPQRWAGEVSLTKKSQKEILLWL
jgi:hypothetical protein